MLCGVIKFVYAPHDALVTGCMPLNRAPLFCFQDAQNTQRDGQRHMPVTSLSCCCSHA